MNKYALIKDNTVFQIVESEKKPDWPTMPDGHKPLFVLVPEGETVETGFTYDKKTGKFTPYEGYDPNPPEPVQPEPTFNASEILLAQSLGIEIDISPRQLMAALPNVPIVELEQDTEWRPGVKANDGQKLTYKGITYVVIQSKGHVTQTGWEPDKTPDIFDRFTEDYDDWIQPIGSHNAYSIGDIRRYNGILYISQINANATVPGADERWWKVYEQ